MLISDVIILLRYPLSQPDGCQLSQRESQERCGASATYLFAGLGWYAQNDLFPMNAKILFQGKPGFGWTFLPKRGILSV